MMYFYWTRKGIRPSFFYELPQGELALIRAFYEEHIEELNNTLEVLAKVLKEVLDEEK